MNWLLIFVPISIGLELFAPERYLLIFLSSALAILPLAGWMGRATEQLAERMGEGVGGLLNATFGNAAELIIALAALRAGLHDVVKASIAGSIVGNILLVLGAAMLAGGLRRSEQHFNAAGARSQATMLLLAAIGLILPAAFQAAAGSTEQGLGKLSVSISVVLFLVYSLYLVFVLVTHSALFAGPYQEEKKEGEWSVGRGRVRARGGNLGKCRRTCHRYWRGDEGSDGLGALNCNRFECAGGALRRTGPGIRESLPWPCADGLGLPGRTCADGSSVGDHHGSGGWRRKIRLAQGFATPCRVRDLRPHVFLLAKRIVPSITLQGLDKLGPQRWSHSVARSSNMRREWGRRARTMSALAGSDHVPLKLTLGMSALGGKNGRL